MLLEDRTAVIYGGGGAIGGAVARAFGREGAAVFLAGRTAATLEAVAEAIRAAGGRAETAVVDALDERAVDAYADDVAARAGGIDISFNAISHNSVHGTPLAEMALDDFAGEVITTVTTQFLTARAAARHMIPRGSAASCPPSSGATASAWSRSAPAASPSRCRRTSRAGTPSSTASSARRCSGAQPPSRTSGTWPPSWPPTGRAPSRRPRSTSAAGR